MRTYDFHEIFRITVRSNVPKALRHFEEEFGRFRVPASDQPDLEVTIGDFGIDPEGGAAALGQKLGAGEWMFQKERHKVASWRFAIKGLAAPTTQLLFQGGVFSLDFLQHYAEQIMRYKICQRGFLLVHAGCVALNGRSVLFPGLGHAGKTALALRQTMMGRTFQADDYTFLSSSGQTYSYPRRLHISDHINTVCPAAMRHISLGHRISIKTKFLIYYLTLKYGDLSEALRLDEILPEARISEVANLSAILLLNARDDTELEGPRQIAPDELVERVMAINRYEARRFERVLSQYPDIGHALSLTKWLEHEDDVLRQALDGIPCYELGIPRAAPNPMAVMEQTARIMDGMLE